MSLQTIPSAHFIQSMNLPATAKIVEVGPRDGLQNQSQCISADTKIALINQLSACGLGHIEVGSLVSPKRVPQMADSARIYQNIKLNSQVQYLMLIANKKGLDKVLELGTKRIAVFCAASEAFSQNNMHCDINASLHTIQALCQQALAAGISIRAYISCALGCPFQGQVNIRQVIHIAEKLDQFGCDEISLGDTPGTATAGQVKSLLEAISQSLPIEHIAVHFHNSYGQAMANILMALQSGVHIIDSSVSGLGGCPFAPGASGNVATEDVIYLLNGLGIETGVDLDKLISTSWFISQALNQQPASATALAYRAKK